MAVLVLLMIPAGLVMVRPGLTRAVQDGLFIFHKNMGVLLLLLVILRLIYRLRFPPQPLPPSVPRWQRFAAAASHGALYLLLIVMPLSGYVRVRAGGFPIEGLDATGIGTLLPKSTALAEAAQSVHLVCGYALIGLIALHIAAALQHALWYQDGIWARIWPPDGGPR